MSRGKGLTYLGWTVSHYILTLGILSPASLYAAHGLLVHHNLKRLDDARELDRRVVALLDKLPRHLDSSRHCRSCHDGYHYSSGVFIRCVRWGFLHRRAWKSRRVSCIILHRMVDSLFR